MVQGSGLLVLPFGVYLLTWFVTEFEHCLVINIEVYKRFMELHV
jgi:hypothetical protein